MKNTTTLEKCLRMMEYLSLHSYVIPHHNIELPEQADGKNYRAEKCFRLLKNGTIHYKGWSCAPNGLQMDINTFGIIPNDRWLDRAYVFMVMEVRNKILRKTQLQTDIKDIGNLILRFNQLDFVDLYCE
jgi:hypothetical protein